MAEPNTPAGTAPSGARRRAAAPPAPEPTTPEAPAIRKAVQQGPSVQQLMHELKDWFTTMARALASYSALNGALKVARGHKPAEGERVRGMPIFEFPATVDGTDSIKCSLDLERVRKDWQEHVILPLATLSAQDLLDAVEEIEARIVMVKPLLVAMTGAQQQEQQ